MRTTSSSPHLRTTSNSPHRHLAAAVGLLAAVACAEAPTTAPSGAASRPAASIAAPVASNKGDLAVQSVTQSPTSPTSNDLVTFSATVANVGQNKIAKDFDVLFDFGTGFTEVVTVPGLAGGASVVVTSTPRALPVGTRTATVTADYDLKIKEPDESNNSATDTYTVASLGITFEVDASGNPICAQGCDVSNEFASQGVTFSFQSTATTQTNASLCDGSRIDPAPLYDPVNHVVNHEVTGLNGGYPCGGGYTGVLTMTFSGAPTTVRFVLRAPESCTPTPVSATAVGAGTPSISYTTTARYLYNGTSLYALERNAVVTSATGIATISVNIAGCAEYVDDLQIIP